MEYQRFGDKIVRRADVSEDWQDVPEDELEEARIEVRAAELVKERYLQNRTRSGARIIRAGQQ